MFVHLAVLEELRKTHTQADGIVLYTLEVVIFFINLSEIIVMFRVQVTTYYSNMFCLHKNLHLSKFVKLLCKNCLG